MNLRVRVPNTIKTGSEVRALLVEALDRRLKPLPVPSLSTESIAMYLDAVTASRVISQFDGESSLQNKISGLVAAAVMEKRPANASVPESKPRTERDILQDRLVSYGVTAWENKKIALLEGGTGVGKSRVIARLAAVALENKRKVIVVAPSMVVLSHLLAEWKKWSGSAPHGRVVVGRDQFLDPAKVLEFASASPKASEILTWLKQDHPPLCVHTQLLYPLLPVGAYLFEDDLISIDSNFPVAECRFSRGEMSDVVAQMRAEAMESNLVWSTHGTLAWNFIAGSEDGTAGLLPDLDVLLVDEAHELEECVANAMTQEISLEGLRRNLEEGVRSEVWKKHRRQAAAERTLESLEVLNRFISSGWKSGRHLLHGDQAGQLTSLIKVTSENLTLVTKGIEGKGFDEIKEASYALSRIAKGNTSTWIDITHVRHWVRLVVGPRSASWLLERIWEKTPSANLLSGTMTLPDLHGRNSFDFVLDRLSIPKDRAFCPEPCVPSWVKARPVVYTPGECAKILSFDAETVDNGEWVQSAAHAVAWIGMQSSKSALILCTSFSDIREIAQRVSEMKPDLRLVIHSPDKKLGECKKDIISSPGILLATGSAWTGFDLVGPKGEEIITDLVILKAPFGLNRSSTQLQRRIKRGPTSDTTDTAMRLKQGLGRLVRTVEGDELRIWVLDGRLFRDIRSPLKSVTRVLASYPKQDEFPKGLRQAILGKK